MKFLYAVFVLYSFVAMAADVYPDFATLSQHEKENEDFRISVIDHRSSITLLAIHGGSIETGTSELTNAIKGNFNRYLFEGMKKENNFSLHLTATHFDEPRALELVSRSKNCLSLHGYRGSGKKAVCVGGGNEILASLIISKLNSLNENIEIIYPCVALPGKDKRNIVNRCEQQGVQLEMNDDLRDEIVRNPAFRNKLSNSLSDVLEQL